MTMISERDWQVALSELPTIDSVCESQARARQDVLTKPQGSLGRLEELAIWLSGWQGIKKPSVNKATCLVFAGNHGVVKQGVSAFPAEVTAQMVMNFEVGGAAINQLCKASGADLKVISLDLDSPTADFTEGPAMSAEECSEAIQQGMDAVSEDIDILLLGEMGIGNSTSAAALSAATFGGEVAPWVGAGTGLDAAQMQHKSRVIEGALERHKGQLASSFEILTRLGGRELAAIVGAVLKARQCRIPVLLDGFICTAAAAVLTRDNPQALDHCQIAHLSQEPGHKRLAEALGKNPILNLNMRLGEASGAATALMILKSAVAVHNGMATFDEAGVSNRDG